jgi:hypothetical protein
VLETNPESVPARELPGSIACAAGAQRIPANAASGATHATLDCRTGLISLPDAF